MIEQQHKYMEQLSLGTTPDPNTTTAVTPVPSFSSTEQFLSTHFGMLTRLRLSEFTGRVPIVVASDPRVTVRRE
jgi:hypothetical protein